MGGDPIGYPSTADGLYIVAYLVFLAAVLTLARRSERLERGELIDAAIVAVAAAVVYWTLVIDPAIDGNQMTGMGRLVTLAYPAVDICLAAVLGRAIFGARRRPTAFWLIAGSIGAQLLADLGYAAQTIDGSFAYGQWVTVGYMVQYALMGAAALHPSALRVTEGAAGASGKSSAIRRLLTGSALSIGPFLLLLGPVREDADRALVAVGGTIVLAWLILRRLSGLLVTVEEHRETEARLKKAELRYRALVESVPGIVYVAGVDTDGTWRYVSPRIAEVFGYAPEEWLSHPNPWTTHVHPDDLDEAMADERAGIDGGHLSSVYRMRSKDGRMLWIYDVASLVPGEGDQPSLWQGLMSDITWMKEVEERLHTASEERRRLLRRLVTAHEEERTRLAHDLHDDPIQKMTAAGLRLATLAARAPEDLSGAIDEVQSSVSDAIGRLRKLMFDLRPNALNHQGLAAALKDHLWDISREGGFGFEIKDGLTSEPDDESRSAVFRIAQEALVNVRKHAGARRVEIVLRTRDGGTLVEVADDGRGFSPNGHQARGHLGLTSMRERAELLGGWCRVSSEPGTGTTVEFWVPAHPERLQAD